VAQTTFIFPAQDFDGSAMCSYTNKSYNAADILLPFSSIMDIIQYNFYGTTYPKTLWVRSTDKNKTETKHKQNKTETVKKQK
jgi:hypothetical protein